MKEKHPILFDLDGTLTDSGEGIIKSAQYAFEKMHMHVPEMDELRVFVGPPLSKEFQEFGVREEDVDTAIKYYRQRYLTIGKYENTPYPGIEELLKGLQEDGYRLMIATSKPEALAIEVLQHFGLDSYFEIIAGATVSRERETKQDVLEYLLNQIEFEKTVLVGDTEFDVEGANAMHIPCIGVNWGYGDLEKMKEVGAVCIVNSMDELNTVLRKQIYENDG